MEAYSIIPYEKGYAFIKYLQELIGTDNFFEFLRNLIQKHKYGCLEFIDVKDCFCLEVKRLMTDEESEKVLSEIDWENWAFSTGYPLIEPKFEEI